MKKLILFMSISNVVNFQEEFLVKPFEGVIFISDNKAKLRALCFSGRLRVT